MNTSGIYKIKCLKNGRAYIGQSSRIKSRLGNHINHLRRGIHKHIELQNDFNLYGEDFFIKGIVEFCSIDNLNKKEAEYIIKYNTLEGGYNNKIPKWGATLNEFDYGGRIKLYNKHNNMLLCICEDIAAASIIVRVPQIKIYNAINGKTTTPYRLYEFVILKEDHEINTYLQDTERVRLKNLKKQIRLTPEEFKEKQRRNALKAVEKTKKKVNQISIEGNIINTFKSPSDAARELDISVKGIYKVTSGKKKTYKGFIWKYV